MNKHTLWERWNRQPPKQVFDAKKLYKYNQKSDSYVIDISLDYYQDVYDEWDYSPFKNRDIDKDLVEYLEECSLEIPLRSKIIINFHLPKKMENPAQEHKSISSMRNHFRYTLLKMTHTRKRYYFSLWLYTVSGIVFLISAYLLQNAVSSFLLLNIVPDGLFIGGWVLFWEAFSIAFFKNHELNYKIKEYKRFSEAIINFVYDNISSTAN
jgi:hypothetical protein